MAMHHSCSLMLILVAIHTVPYIEREQVTYLWSQLSLLDIPSQLTKVPHFVNLNVLLEPNFRSIHIVTVRIRILSTICFSSLKPKKGVASSVSEWWFWKIEVQRWVIFCWQKVSRFCLKKVLALDTISSRQSEKITYPSTLAQCLWLII